MKPPQKKRISAPALLGMQIEEQNKKIEERRANNPLTLALKIATVELQRLYGKSLLEPLTNDEIKALETFTRILISRRETLSKEQKKAWSELKDMSNEELKQYLKDAVT